MEHWLGMKETGVRCRTLELGCALCPGAPGHAGGADLALGFESPLLHGAGGHKGTGRSFMLEIHRAHLDVPSVSDPRTPRAGFCLQRGGAQAAGDRPRLSSSLEFGSGVTWGLSCHPSLVSPMEKHARLFWLFRKLFWKVPFKSPIF